MVYNVWRRKKRNKIEMLADSYLLHKRGIHQVHAGDKVCSARCHHSLINRSLQVGVLRHNLSRIADIAQHELSITEEQNTASRDHCSVLWTCSLCMFGRRRMHSGTPNICSKLPQLAKMSGDEVLCGSVLFMLF